VQFANAPGDRQRSIFVVAALDAQGSAVRRQFLDVEKRDVMVRKNHLDRHRRQVAVVLVVDGVKPTVFLRA